MLSIAEHNQERSSALFGGAAAFSTALVEALAVLQHGHNEVLLLCGDETVPEPWRPLLPSPILPHAMGLLLSNHPSPNDTSLTITPSGTTATTRPVNNLPQDLRFLAWLLGNRHLPLELADGNFQLTLQVWNQA